MSDLENGQSQNFDFSSLPETNFKVTPVTHEASFNPTSNPQLPTGTETVVNPETGLESTEPVKAPIETEIDKAKEAVETSTPEEKTKNEYNLKKLEHMAALEGRWRSDKTNLTSELEALKAQLAEMKGQKTVDSYEVELKELARRNPKKFFDQFGGNSDLFFDQHMGITDSTEESPEPKAFSAEDIERMVNEKFEARMGEQTQANKKADFDRKVTEYQSSLDSLIEQTDEYPIMKRVGTQQHIGEAFAYLKEANGIDPTPKEVVVVCEAYLKQEMDGHYKQPTRTLSSDIASPSRPGMGTAPQQSAPDKYGSMSRNEQDFRNLIDNLPD